MTGNLQSEWMVYTYDFEIGRKNEASFPSSHLPSARRPEVQRKDRMTDDYTQFLLLGHGSTHRHCMHLGPLAEHFVFLQSNNPNSKCGAEIQNWPRWIDAESLKRRVAFMNEMNDGSGLIFYISNWWSIYQSINLPFYLFICLTIQLAVLLSFNHLSVILFWGLFIASILAINLII